MENSHRPNLYLQRCRPVCPSSLGFGVGGSSYSNFLASTVVSKSSHVLYYTILYYTILYYTILYYTILYYTILYYTILYYTILYYTILYYTILYYTILYYTTLYCTIPSGGPAVGGLASVVRVGRQGSDHLTPGPGSHHLLGSTKDCRGLCWV